MNLLSKITLWSFMLFFLFQSNTALADSKDSTKLEKTLLWKITGKGIKPSYLFGTIHIIQKKDYFWDKKMEKAFKKTKKIVTEIDMSQLLVTSLQMMQLAPMEGGKTLKDLLSEEEYTMVKKYFTEEAKSAQTKMTPFSIIENWKPMLIQSLLYNEMIEGPVESYEMQLTTKAQKANMNFGGLETMEDQIAVFNKISYEAQAKILVETVQNLKEGKNGANEFAQLVEQYKTQDVDGMLEFMSGDLEEMNGQEALLDGRNKKWIPKILEMSKKEKVFYAVGAGHLGGSNGVIRLLRKAGLKVTPVLK